MLYSINYIMSCFINQSYLPSWLPQSIILVFWFHVFVVLQWH